MERKIAYTTSLIDVSLEEESATRQRTKKNKKNNRTGATGIIEVVLGSSKNHRILEVGGDFWTWPDPNSSSSSKAS